ncbi:MAG: site-specific integrase, partial [Dictyoglomus turgidum]
MKDKLEDFLFYLKFEKNMSPNTIDSYRRDLEDFIIFLQKEKVNIKN